MAVIFFKRLRMQIDLHTRQFARSVPPPDYDLHPWQEKLLEAHADAKSRSFRDELDANLFPSLAEPDGCLRLMNEISCRQGFVPQATWLITFRDPKTGRQENCGTVQGIHEQYDIGAIQNIGVSRNHRGRGLGSLIINQCLQGFQQVGIRYVTLEVTAHNTGAIRLYERIGFRIQRIVFKINHVVDP